MGDQRLTSLRVRIDAPDVDDDEMDRLTRTLRTELREQTDAEEVDLVETGPAPAGTKGAGALELGNLAVTLLPVAVPGLIAALRSWAARHKQQGEMKVTVKVGDRALDLEYPVGTMTRADLLQLISVVTAAPAGDGPKA